MTQSNRNVLKVPNQWLYYLVGIGGCFISVLMWYTLVLQSQNNLNRIVELQAEHIANDIKAQIELQATALKQIQDTPTLLQDVKSILNLQLNHRDYFVAVSRNNFIFYTDTLSRETPPASLIKTIQFTLYGATWRIIIQPSEALASAIRTNLPNVALVLGICIALLFMIATHLATLSRQRAKALLIANADLIREAEERTKAEEAKTSLEKELIQGQKLQAIGTLAGGIAHDFNNILYAITGYADMARDDVPPKSLTFQHLEKVLEAAQRGQSLIARILAFSRRQHHELKPVAIRECIESVFSLLRPTIPATVTIDIQDELTPHTLILGDQTAIHQVIVNLVTNAVDAMQGEGIITVISKLIESEDAILKNFPNIQKHRYCYIELRDTGHGMDQNTLTRIFEPFFTTKDVGKGTGLGLATVYRIVKEHKGEIIVSTIQDHGTTFIILLPEYTAGE